MGLAEYVDDLFFSKPVDQIGDKGIGAAIIGVGVALAVGVIMDKIRKICSNINISAQPLAEITVMLQRWIVSLHVGDIVVLRVAVIIVIVREICQSSVVGPTVLGNDASNQRFNIM